MRRIYPTDTDEEAKQAYDRLAARRGEWVRRQPFVLRTEEEAQALAVALQTFHEE